MWFLQIVNELTALPGLAFVGRVEYFADVLEIFHEIITTDVVSLQPLHDVLQPARTTPQPPCKYRYYIVMLHKP